jgi:hypothetical protein
MAVTSESTQSIFSPSHERAVLWLIFLAGLIPVAIAIAARDAWSAEPTIGMLMSLFAGHQLARTWAERIREALRRSGLS